MDRRGAPFVVAAAAAVSLLAACSSGDGGDEVNPLTGVVGVPEGPVVAVKVENTSRAWPQQGLNDADVVYLEQVEGGQTRLLALYASQRPAEVFPVRSARETDVELLAQHGAVVLAYSGANDGVLATIDDSDLVSVSEPEYPELFGTVPGREKVYGTTVDVAAVADRFPDAAGPSDMGLTWGDPGEVWSDAPAAPSFSVSMGSQTASFTWDEAEGAWRFGMQGRELEDAGGGPVYAENVVVQSCRITDSAYVDVTGAPTPFTETVGTGAAVLFRDGKQVTGTWSRAGLDDGTTFRTAAGEDVPLSPGGAWVLLAPEGNPVTVS